MTQSDRVLLIEDDAPYALLLRETLARLGLTTDIAAKEEQAWSYLRDQSYRLIILDLGLDEGIFNFAREAFCEQIRQRYRDVPVLGITALHLAGAQIFGLRNYIDAFFEKSTMSPPAFRATVTQLLNGRPAVEPTPRAAREDGRVFVSFSARDKVKAAQVVGALRTAGLKVWWAGDGLRPGDGFVQTITLQLEKASVFLLLWSHSSSESEWVRRERDVATELEIKRGRPLVICARLDDTEPPGLLRVKHHLDLTDFAVSLEDAIRRVRQTVDKGE